MQISNVLNLVPVQALSGTATKGDLVVLSSDGNLYNFDGDSWINNGAVSAGGTTVTKTANVVISTPARRTQTFSISDNSLILGNKILSWIGSNGDKDENSGEIVHIESWITTSGFLNIRLTGIITPILGAFKIYYQKV